MYDRKDFKWEKNKLMSGKMKLAEIYPDSVYPTMWRIKWEDGFTSQDMYNKTRAKENCLLKTMDFLNTDVGSSVGLASEAVGSSPMRLNQKRLSR